jgi:hypothetical protein
MLAGGPPRNKPKLLDQVRGVIRRKQYSIRTKQAYVDWIRRFVLYHNKRHPKEMGEQQVAEFLTHLARDRNVAPATQNQALSALLFLYKKVLKQEIGWLDNVERARKPSKLPGRPHSRGDETRVCRPDPDRTQHWVAKQTEITQSVARGDTENPSV